jgi:hypothetical protein
MSTHVLVWPPFPSLYEINTWVWLSELSQKYGKRVTWSSIPAAEWDAIASYGFDAVWLMGVWKRSPAGIAISNKNQTLLDDFRRALPDFRPEDNAGSPYCIRRYVVDEHLGGPEGLAIARQELSKRGMNLILDFVPNHVALDHPWVAEHPEYFIQANSDDVRKDPSSCIERAGIIFARGRDPFFPAWPDVLQLNPFALGLRQAVIETVSSIARQCDGIRCDMAMLLLNSIFQRTWGSRAGQQPATEYWDDVISAVKKSYPGFIFIAEAYWDLEWELQQRGFDFCYDKKLYDRLEHDSAENIRLHLCADLAYQGKLVRFIENHDEPRAAATFSQAKQQAAALTIATLPGIKLFHEGQLEGRTVRLPVFLGRRPQEPVNQGLQGFYKKLLSAIDKPIFRDGQWSLCERTGWPDNTTYQNLVAWSWLSGDERYLIIVNLSDSPAQGRVKVTWADANGVEWHLLDAISGAIYERPADEMRSPGLYVELGHWNYHFFEFLRTNKA